MPQRFDPNSKEGLKERSATKWGNGPFLSGKVETGRMLRGNETIVPVWWFLRSVLVEASKSARAEGAEGFGSGQSQEVARSLPNKS